MVDAVSDTFVSPWSVGGSSTESKVTHSLEIMAIKRVYSTQNTTKAFIEHEFNEPLSSQMLPSAVYNIKFQLQASN